MIFRTFDGNDGILSKIGIFKKSFADIGKACRDAFETSLDFDDAIFGTNSKNQGFFKNFKNNLIGQANDVSDLYGNLFVTKNDVDKFKVKDFSVYEKDAQGILNDLREQKKLVDASKSTWQDYYEGLSSGEKWQQKFVQENDLLTVSLDDVSEAQDAAKKSAIAFNKGLDEMTIGAKASALAMDALSMAGNILASVLISMAVQAVIKYFDDLAHAQEYAMERSSDLTAKYKDEQSSIQDSISKYEELGKKLEDTSLSASEVKSVKAQWDHVSLSS